MTINKILARLEPIPEAGCFVWTGAESGKGYGTVYFNGKTRRVHRVVYEHLIGPIPDGLEIDHLCRNKLCSNVFHLEAVTTRTNVLRGVAPTAVNDRKTHCIRGHEFTPENTKLRKSRPSYRQCRTCRNMRVRELSREKLVARVKGHTCTGKCRHGEL